MASFEDFYTQATQATELATQWRLWQNTITELYESHKLDDVMKIMKERHGFKATKKQYTFQLKKWHLTKNVKKAEYAAMSRKKRERKDQEISKNSEFVLRGKRVAPSKLIAWEQRMAENAETAIQQFDAREFERIFHYKDLVKTTVPAATPPELVVNTPPSIQYESSRSSTQADICQASTFCPSNSKMNSPVGIRSPSVASFDWFNAYIDYKESGRSTQLVAESPIMQLLRGFMYPVDLFEDRFQYHNVMHGLFVLNHECQRVAAFKDSCRKLEARETKEMERFKSLVRDLVFQVIQSYNKNKRLNSWLLTLIVCSVCHAQLAFGENQEARNLIETTILQMRKISMPKMLKVVALLILAECYARSNQMRRSDDLMRIVGGEIQKLNAFDLISKKFKSLDLMPAIEYLFLTESSIVPGRRLSGRTFSLLLAVAALGILCLGQNG